MRRPPRLPPAARLAAVVACLVLAAVGVRGWAALYRSTGAASWRRRSLVPGDEPAWWALLGLFALLAAVVGYTMRRAAGRRARLAARPLHLEPWLQRWVVIALLAMLPPLMAGLGLAAYAVIGPTKAGGPVEATAGTDATPVTIAAPPRLPVVLVVLAAAALAIAAGLAVASRVGPTGPRAPARVDAEPVPDGLSAALGAAAAALASTATGGPRAAVIDCYAAMEDSLRSTPAAPLASDTPTQVLGRAVAGGLLRGPAAVRLTNLFAEARYSQHPFTVEQQAAAAIALRAIQDELATTARGTA